MKLCSALVVVCALSVTFADIVLSDLEPQDLDILANATDLSLDVLTNWNSTEINHTISPGPLLIDGELNGIYVSNAIDFLEVVATTILENIASSFNISFPIIDDIEGSVLFNFSSLIIGDIERDIVDVIDNEFFYFNGGVERTSFFVNGTLDAAIYATGVDSVNVTSDVVVHSLLFDDNNNDFTGLGEIRSDYFRNRSDGELTTGIVIDLCGINITAPNTSATTFTDAKWKSFVTSQGNDSFDVSLTRTGGALVFNGITAESLFENDTHVINSNEMRFEFTMSSSLVSKLAKLNSSVEICFNVSAPSGFNLSLLESNSSIFGYTVSNASNPFLAYFLPDNTATVTIADNETDIEAVFSTRDEAFYVTFDLFENDTAFTYGSSMGIFRRPTFDLGPPVVPPSGATGGTGVVPGGASGGTGILSPTGGVSGTSGITGVTFGSSGNTGVTPSGSGTTGVLPPPGGVSGVSGVTAGGSSGGISGSGFSGSVSSGTSGGTPSGTSGGTPSGTSGGPPSGTSASSGGSGVTGIPPASGVSGFSAAFGAESSSGSFAFSPMSFVLGVSGLFLVLL
jgi:hypothetical protein